MTEPRCICGHPKSAHRRPAGQPICDHCGGGYAYHAFEEDRDAMPTKEQFPFAVWEVDLAGVPYEIAFCRTARAAFDTADTRLKQITRATGTTMVSHPDHEQWLTEEYADEAGLL